MPARGLGGQADLAAGVVRGLVDDDRVAALGRDARGLEPGGAGADDHDAARRLGLGDRVRLLELAAGRGVVQAERHAALVDAVEAVVGADAGADALLLAAQDLRDDVRVGHVGAGHADHVELAAGDGVAGGGDVLDLGGVEGREVGRGADLAGEVEVRGGAHALHRDHVGQAGVGVDVALHHVEEVDHAAVLQAAGDLQPVGLGQAARQVLVAGVADADDEVVADSGRGSPSACRR